MIGASINAVMYLRVIARKYVSNETRATIPRFVAFHCDSGVVLFGITKQNDTRITEGFSVGDVRRCRELFRYEHRDDHLDGHQRVRRHDQPNDLTDDPSYSIHQYRSTLP